MAQIAKPWQRKTTKTWHVQIDGKQVYLGKNKTEAWKKYNRLIALSSGKVSSCTARQVLMAHFEWLKTNRSPETVASRAKIIKSFGESITPSLKADAIKPFHVQKWIDGNKRIKSPTTANYRIGLIIGIWNWAKRMGYVATNPLADMPKPGVVTRQDFVPPDEWQQVLAHASDQPFKDFLTVMLAAGCRPQEMFKFEASHFDGTRFVLPMVLSKGKRISRVVYLPPEALEVVKRLAVKYPEGKLFRNSNGEPFNRNSIGLRFRRMRKHLNHPKLTATTLRHSYAHQRLTSGQDGLTVSKLMGHVDTRMIATRYGHLEANPAFMQGAANAVSFPTPSDTPASPTA